MILDNWENRALYAPGHPLFAQAFAFVENYLKHPVAPGSYNVTDGVVAKVQCYDTRTEGLYETHDVFIDIQVLIAGAEQVEWCPRKELTPRGDYNAADDAQFYEEKTPAFAAFLLRAGEFAVFFPEDAHKPALVAEKPEKVEKIVLKVRMSPP